MLEQTTDEIKNYLKENKGKEFDAYTLMNDLGFKNIGTFYRIMRVLEKDENIKVKYYKNITKKLGRKHLKKWKYE